MPQISHLETEQLTIGEISATADNRQKIFTIRVSPGSYLAAFFVSTFIVSLLIYFEADLAAAIICLICWIILPVLSIGDKIVFDGKYIYRSGLIYRIWKRLNKHPERLKISEIELIETRAIRAVRNGGKVMYRYRTSVNGLNQNLVFSSGGNDYRRMVKKLFSAVNEESLDVRSIELRDYLAENDKISKRTAFEKIPSVEVLENSFDKIKDKFKNAKLKNYSSETKTDNPGKANDLRILANQLRLSGNLLQSLEAFRRALLIKPNDPNIIFEFSRCLYSYASLQRSTGLMRRANAALRLAHIKSETDANLAALIGETYFQIGLFQNAKKSFKKSNAIIENFRAIRGLAEISLREGKLAYVIMHFQNAFETAKPTALKNWSKNEGEYYSLLNSNENYMDSEVKRIKHLESVERGRKVFLKTTLSGIFITLLGIVFSQNLANIGWVISSVGVLLWIIMLFLRGVLIDRTPFIADEE